MVRNFLLKGSGQQVEVAATQLFDQYFCLDIFASLCSNRNTPAGSVAVPSIVALLIERLLLKRTSGLILTRALAEH